jgi:hypothetical protein
MIEHWDGETPVIIRQLPASEEETVEETAEGAAEEEQS